MNGNPCRHNQPNWDGHCTCDEHLSECEAAWENNAPPRARLIVQTMDQLHAEGIQPTGRRIVERIGGYWGAAGFNGRDGAVFTAHMRELGYVQPGFPGSRWKRP